MAVMKSQQIEKPNKQFKKEVLEKLLDIIQIKELKMKFFGLYNLKQLKKRSQDSVHELS